MTSCRLCNSRKGFAAENDATKLPPLTGLELLARNARHVRGSGTSQFRRLCATRITATRKPTIRKIDLHHSRLFMSPRAPRSQGRVQPNSRPALPVADLLLHKSRYANRKRPKVEEQLSLPRKFDAPVACDPPPERFGGMATSLSDVLGTEYCEVRCHEWRDPALYFMWRRRYSPLATFARGLPQAISSPYRSSLTFPGHLQAPRRRHISAGCRCSAISSIASSFRISLERRDQRQQISCSSRRAGTPLPLPASPR